MLQEDETNINSLHGIEENSEKSEEKEVNLLTINNLATFDEQIKTPKVQQTNSVKKKCNRTPSGNILTNQVQSVRVFFSPTEKDRQRFKLEKLQQIKTKRQHDQGHLERNASRASEHHEISQPISPQQTTPHHDQRSNEGVINQNKKRKISVHQSDISEEKKQENETMPEKSDNEMEIDQGDVQSFLKEHDISESATVVDVRTVLEMFNKLSKKMDTESIKKEIEEDVNRTMEIYDKKIKDLEKDVRNTNRRAKLMEDILSHNQQLMHDITKRLDGLELANARKMAILSGLSFSRKKNDRLKELNDFLYKELEVYTRIEDTYLLGDKENSPVVITFQTLEDKETVFAKKSNLKEIGKEMKKKIFLNHYLPTAENEKRKRERKIMADLKNSNEKNKPETEYGKEGLLIGKEPYRKKVEAPHPTELLKYTVEEIDEIMGKKVLKGPQIQMKDSTFIPYAIDTNSFGDIRDIYMKLRLVHAAARHIVCAYHLPGPDSQKHINSDFCDDQENGAGSVILKEMVKSDIFNKAFFIVRYCGKEKLSGKRFTTYLDAAKGLLDQKPMNNFLNKRQAFLIDEQDAETQFASTGYRYKQQRNTDEKTSKTTAAPSKRGGRK